MSEFKILKSTATPLRIDNVDTDQIIPARYLLMITKDGYGQHLFNDWRYNEDGSEKPDFVLNNPVYKGSQILLAGENFGSGSSREHAVWAIDQYGYRAVIAPSFSDIFTNNAYGNGLLVFKLPKEIVFGMIDKVEKNPGYEFTIDLPNQTFTTQDGEEYKFEINEFVKEKIVKGLDNIGYILDKKDMVEKYEKETGK
jgi:3-isopropylmalate/(R)-2-methylmalate dehydratase small subunit